MTPAEARPIIEAACEAWLAKGCIIESGAWRSSDECIACALGTLPTFDGDLSGRPSAAYIAAAALGITYEQAWSFARGFDNCSPNGQDPKWHALGVEFGEKYLAGDR